MKTVEILESPQFPLRVAKLEDGTYRWLDALFIVQPIGPTPDFITSTNFSSVELADSLLELVNGPEN